MSISTFLPKLGLLLLLPLAWQYLRSLLFRFAWRRLNRGNHKAGLAAATIIGTIPTLTNKVLKLQLRAHALSDSGSTSSAVMAARALIAMLPRRICPWMFVNSAIDVLVNAGLYSEAATLHEQWSVGACDRGIAYNPGFWAVAQVNRAEALHNLGRNDEALAILAEVETNARSGRLALNGARCLRAWIRAATGDTREARDALDALDVTPLAARYLPEVHYTRSALELAVGAYAEAMKEAWAGLARAQRASSKRNGLFLLGKIARAQGNLELARSYFERGANHVYQAQCADGLVALADVCSALGLEADCDAALRLVLERDAESHFAGPVRERLSGSKAVEDSGCTVVPPV